jgi:tripartite-type tricarboxylate transporter receptor subunit TctC
MLVAAAMHAQNYPSWPTTLVVPFTAGNGIDPNRPYGLWPLQLKRE